MNRKNLNKLREQWTKVGTPAYYTQARCKHFKNIKSIIKKYVSSNDTVLDIGCNAALCSIYLAKYAKSVIGIEPRKLAFKHALITLKYFNNPKNIEIFNENLRTHYIQHYNNNISCIFASKVIYHFTKKQQDIFKIILQEPCVNKIIVQTNTKYRGKKTLWNNAYRVDYIQELLLSLGFNKLKLIYNDTHYPFVIGVKENRIVK